MPLEVHSTLSAVRCLLSYSKQVFPLRTRIGNKNAPLGTLHQTALHSAEELSDDVLAAIEGAF
jgi:hypothetical protein